MDLKKLATFVIVAGALVFAFGGVKYLSNTPTEVVKDDTPLGIGTALVALGNISNEERQDDAKKIMIAGGIILIIGAGFFFSLKKPA